MQKLSEIYVEDQRTAFVPSDVPGELPNSVIETYQRKLPVKTTPSGLRIIHFLVDLIGVFATIMVLAVLTGFVIAALSANDEILDEDAFYNFLWLGSWVLYYIIFEGLFQTTLGKLVTGSIVVDEYGNKPKFGQIVGRSFSRLVPFEHFSCIGEPSRGWHDSWNDTYVVRKKDLAWMKAKLAEQHEGEGYVYNSLIAREL